MKADVFLPTAPPELDVPSWVPNSIAQFVRAKYAADVHSAYTAAIRENESCDDDEAWALAAIEDARATYVDIVRDDLVDIAERYRALVCDHRMRRVWQELFRLRNGAFLYPACMSAAVTNTKDRQEAALLELFKTALECQNHVCSIAHTTRAEAKQQRRRYLAKADELNNDAITVLTQHLDGELTDIKKRSALGGALLAAAKAYKAYANAIRRVQSALPERDRDTRAQAVALTISNKFRTLFGSPMYGLTANIASVVLNRRIDPGTVRHFCSPCS